MGRNDCNDFTEEMSISRKARNADYAEDVGFEPAELRVIYLGGAV